MQDCVLPPQRWWTPLLVWSIVLLAVFFQLGKRALNEPDEGRYAEIGREMLATGDWLTPRLNGIPHLSKPPLTYWCVAASLGLFGINEFAARLPSALAAIGTLTALYAMVRSASNQRSALWAVVMLTTSGMFFLTARLITADMLLTCWVCWSVWTLWQGSNWLFVFLALGFLTKGPGALLLPLFAGIGLRPRLKQFHWGRGILVFTAITAPWFVAVTIQNPGLWHYFVVREIFQRVATTEHGRVEPWWFLILATLGGFLPWTFVAVGQLPRAGAARMFGTWLGLGLAFFTLSQSKLPTYALPLMPAMAALAATAPPRPWHRPATAIALVVALGLALYYLRTRCDFPAASAIALATIAGCGAICTLVRIEAAAITFLVVVLGVISALPKIERQLRHNTSAKFFAERILREDPQRQALVICHVTFPRGLPFYLQSPVWWYNPAATNRAGVFEFDHPAPGAPFVVTDHTCYLQMLTGTQRVFCIARADAAQTIKSLTGMTWHELERTGKGVLLSNKP
ncbi:MAG: glycosyltransferase family 39 protein [Verrucomicrobiae bacterium]|nr:glycosyltransferase family 39 protein [Verrucomicrobiae bacterium]